MNIQLASLTKKYFSHKVGEIVTVLSFTGSGLFRVKFEDGSTDTIGISRLDMINQ